MAINKALLVKSGKNRIEWASTRMPVLNLIKNQFSEDKPLNGVKIGGCLHLTTETAVLALTLKAAGADVCMCASNPLSTQDDVVAYLNTQGLKAIGFKGESSNDYYKAISQVVAFKPKIIMDDGGDLTNAVMDEKFGAIGGTEETTTGILRLKALEKAGKLGYPVIGVNDADTKHLFDNRYGTGQSTIDGILRATNLLIAGKTFVVGGYGWVGRGIALRARGMGANVIVTEIDPVKALEAHMDGFSVKSMDEAAKVGDIFVTATGDVDIITGKHINKMKDLAVMANSGHFNVEINVEELEHLATKKREIREQLEEYTMRDGRRILLISQGRLVNLSSAEGHPSEVMDMSFANQALSAVYILNHYKGLENKVYNVPKEIDERVAKLKLESLGIKIDSLSDKQKRYLSSYEIGT
jgi:adenosylhomocysteinase